MILKQPMHSWPTTLSLHDALPIFDGAAAGRSAAVIIDEGAQRGAERDLDDSGPREAVVERAEHRAGGEPLRAVAHDASRPRSEEHTSELQSHVNLVCRLLLETQKF